jgi:non-specific serine/threonine protein kinase
LSLGFLHAASRVATNAVEEARGTSQPIVLCIALAWEAGLICLSLGDLETAERYGEELIDHADRHGMRPFHAAGLCVRGSLAAKRGNPESGLDPLRRGLAEMQAASYLLFYPFFKAELAAALGAMGRVDEGLAEIDGAMQFAEQTDYRWFVPEILRAKGELLALRGSENPVIIADLFRQSISLAHDQQALYWELRAATSLAELLRGQHREAEARAVLAPVYGRFTEGFATPKMQQAKALLDQLA